ncbi:hypothetical protein DPMN_188853 [Dreissena polymorpha]|uniref:Uncharacterized protein n=1 Tax=Dreissena polymorpha TaxID=45954 RepID=A0A9D4DTT3_DREPO|nr:hypothetical protein DPMN_188853 [Dreissena polymorpha]
MTDPAFKIVNPKQPQFLIWRIEKLTVQMVPKQQYGNFYKGDSYIVLSIASPGQRRGASVQAANQLPPDVSVLGQFLQLPPCLAHLLSICIQVSALGVLAHLISICIQVSALGVYRLPPLPLLLGVLADLLSICIQGFLPICSASASRWEIALLYWMQACKGFSLSITKNMKDVIFNRMLLCSCPKTFLGDLVWQADLKDLPEAGVDEDLFLYGDCGGLPGLCSIEEFWLYNFGLEHSYLPSVDGEAQSANTLRLARFLPPAKHHPVTAQRRNYFHHCNPLWNSVERSCVAVENQAFSNMLIRTRAWALSGNKSCGGPPPTITVDHQDHSGPPGPRYFAVNYMFM